MFDRNGRPRGCLSPSGRPALLGCGLPQVWRQAAALLGRFRWLLDRNNPTQTNQALQLDDLVGVSLLKQRWAYVSLQRMLEITPVRRHTQPAATFFSLFFFCQYNQQLVARDILEQHQLSARTS